VDDTITQPAFNHNATRVVLVGLIARSFGLATGVGLAILLASALFAL
jgi:hypothetical protein